MTDNFTHYVQAYPTKDERATTVAKVLVEKLFVHYVRIHSNQGRDFESRFVRQLWTLLGIKKSRTTPYHPQGDPQPERFNQVSWLTDGDQNLMSFVNRFPGYQSTKSDLKGNKGLWRCGIKTICFHCLMGSGGLKYPLHLLQSQLHPGLIHRDEFLLLLYYQRKKKMMRRKNMYVTSSNSKCITRGRRGWWGRRRGCGNRAFLDVTYRNWTWCRNYECEGGGVPTKVQT